MEEKKYIEPQLVEESDEIDLAELLRKLFRERKRIYLWCFVAALIGLVLAFSIPVEYTVNSKLAPETVSKTGSTGSLGSLASLAGINLGSMSTSDAVSPDLYPDIVSSTPFVVELFPVQVEFRHGKDTLKTDFYTYLDEYNRKAWWVAGLQLPFKALEWFRGLFHEQVEEVKGYASLDPSALTWEQEKIAKSIRGDVSLTVDKKTSVISLNVTAQDPHVAASISKEVISRLQTYVTNYRTEKSRQDLKYYESLYVEARDAYFTAQQRYARYVDSNQGVILQRVKTEQERLQNEMNLNYQLYNTCAQQLQAAKAKVQQETPVFTIINPPQVPIKRSKPARSTILFASILLGGVAASVWILWGRGVVASFKKKEEEDR